MANRGVRESRDILKVLLRIGCGWILELILVPLAVRERDSREERKFDLLIGFCKI